ncbi:MAG: hypothetical protein M1453_10455 [Acidobacteria bacterium]|nr:hypothetical protein [Acidobacteriota bacterium]MCL5288399.1 hypothetical protein [Acidobacteriota bacterium]
MWRPAGTIPYGENWYETGGANKLKFTSYERDTGVNESGNDYALMRYHVNHLGRFNSPDPIAGSVADPQSFNRYAYTLNDPVNLVDPLGLNVCYRDDGTVIPPNEGGDTEANCSKKNGTWIATIAQTVIVSGGGGGGGSTIVLIGSAGSGCVDVYVEGFLVGNTCGLNAPSGSDAANQEGGGTTVLDDRANALGRALNATGIQALNPEPCGGGYFAGRGEEREAGVAHGGTFVLVNRDSRSGTSVGVLAEGGVGPVAYGYEKSVNPSSGEVESSHLLFVGKDAGAFVAVSGSKSPIQLGAYFFAFGRGGGAYVNVVPGGQCHP